MSLIYSRPDYRTVSIKNIGTMDDDLAALLHLVANIISYRWSNQHQLASGNAYLEPLFIRGNVSWSVNLAARGSQYGTDGESLRQRTDDLITCVLAAADKMGIDIEAGFDYYTSAVP